MTSQDSDNDLIGLAEAKVICGYSHEHLRRMCEQGKLPGKKITGNWVISRRVALILKEKKRWSREDLNFSDV